MRTSQVALLSAVGVVLLMVVGVMMAFRVALTNFDGDYAAGADVIDTRPGDTVTTTLNLRGFSEIVANESWRIEIVQSDTWDVEVRYPENLNASAAVAVQDGRLMLDSDELRPRWWNWGGGRDTSSARISMPELEAIVVNGGADIEIAGFRGDRLAVTVHGASNIEGRNSEFRELTLTLNGASRVDFRSLYSVDAQVHLAGATHVELAMNGGELSGELSGFGRVTYSGYVSSENVAISGFGRVAPAEFEPF